MVRKLLLEVFTALLDFPALREALLHAENDGDARALREALGQLLVERERMEDAVPDGEKLLVTDIRDDFVSVPLIEIVDFALILCVLFIERDGVVETLIVNVGETDCVLVTRKTVLVIVALCCEPDITAEPDARAVFERVSNGECVTEVVIVGEREVRGVTDNDDCAVKLLTEVVEELAVEEYEGKLVALEDGDADEEDDAEAEFDAREEVETERDARDGELRTDGVDERVKHALRVEVGEIELDKHVKSNKYNKRSIIYDLFRL